MYQGAKSWVSRSQICQVGFDGACWYFSTSAIHISGFNAEAVAELTLGLAISVSRRIVEFDRRLRAGETVPCAVMTCAGVDLYLHCISDLRTTSASRFTRRLSVS